MCIILIVISFGMAYLLATFNSMSLVTAFLAIAPGGIDVMGITAKEVNADLSTVTAYQMFRLFVICF